MKQVQKPFSMHTWRRAFALCGLVMLMSIVLGRPNMALQASRPLPLLADAAVASQRVAATAAPADLAREIAKLTAADGEAGDDFGVVVSPDSATALVGANQKNSFTGAANIFDLPGIQSILLEDDFDGENGGVGRLNYSGFAHWNVTRGTVDLIGNGLFDFLPGHGLYIDLDGTSSAAGRMETKTTFTLEPGVAILSFALAGSQRASPDDQVQVSLGTLYSESFTPATLQPFQTVIRQIEVQQPTTAKLVFDHAGGDANGLLLDDVQLNHIAAIVVNTNNDEHNSDGDCSLREAISAANLDAQVDTCQAGNGADTIFVPEGIYVITLPSTHEDGNLDGDLDINSDMTIIGAGASRTIVDGNNAAVPFGLSIGGGRFVALSDMTVRNGNATIEGGNGGGIWAGGTEGYLTLTNMAIVDNFAPGAQGGIAAGRRMTITNSLIANNRTNGTGGGFDSAGAVMLLINTTVSGNHAGQGGGIANSGQVTLINSTIAGNHADQAGAGIFNAQGTVNLLNTLVAGNTNAANASHDCAGAMTSQGYNLIGNTSGCTIIGETTGNLTGMDPLLGPLQDNGGETLTHALLTSSLAIDAGSPAVPGSGGTACAATDQRGVLRPLDGDGDTQTPLRCDIGAFELCRQGFTQSCFTPGSPPPPSTSSPLRLSLFTSEVISGSVTLHWETEAEADNLGFNLYRLEDDDAIKINSELIPAQGNVETGATYQFVDRPGSGHYTYLIKNVDQQGVEHLRGQVEVEAEGYIFFLPALSAP